ncbi:hypothetical protein B0O99DRAFT_748287 [Bisporella sp. PMI_857]|nr:hypothetical protein B0O99DRAFT_748287 [Bisporella sp. PMI_857]
MRTKRYTMSTRNTQASKSPSPIDDPASPTSNGDESTELTIPPSTPSLRPTNTSIPSTPTSNIPTRYGSTSAMSDTTIEDHFGVHPRGRDAIASFPNNITKINPTDYTWTTNKYQNWTVDVLLSAETDKALDRLLKTGPWSTFTKPNRYSILRTKTTLGAVKDDLRDDDDEGFVSLGHTITTNDPFPYTYNGSMMVENGAVPNAGFDVRNFSNQASIAVEFSILGYQIDGKEPGYSFGMRGVYHLGNPLRDKTGTPSKKRKGGCIISPRRRKAGVFKADTSNPSPD